MKIHLIANENKGKAFVKGTYLLHDFQPLTHFFKCLPVGDVIYEENT